MPTPSVTDEMPCYRLDQPLAPLPLLGRQAAYILREATPPVRACRAARAQPPRHRLPRVDPSDLQCQGRLCQGWSCRPAGQPLLNRAPKRGAGEDWWWLTKQSLCRLNSTTPAASSRMASPYTTCSRRPIPTCTHGSGGPSPSITRPPAWLLWNRTWTGRSRFCVASSRHVTRAVATPAGPATWATGSTSVSPAGWPMAVRGP